MLCAGGFIFNREMTAEHVPEFLPGLPLGTHGDDGIGIRLGQSVGGKVDQMHRASAWRFLYPPNAFAEGMLINGNGERFAYTTTERNGTDWDLHVQDLAGNKRPVFETDGGIPAPEVAPGLETARVASEARDQPERNGSPASTPTRPAPASRQTEATAPARASQGIEPGAGRGDVSAPRPPNMSLTLAAT